MKMPFASARRLRFHVAAVVAALLLLAPIISLNAADATRDATAGAELAALDTRGDFDQILTRFKGDLDPMGGQTDDLLAHIARFQDNRSRQRAERVSEYNEVLGEMADLLAKDELEKALFKAAEAQSLAIDKAESLETLADLIAKAETAARSAETEHEWLNALSIYRSLDALFNQDGTYHDDLKRVANHVRVLRVYAPERLQKLYEARLERLQDPENEEVVDPIQLDNEDWVKRLADVEMPMLRQTFVHAARNHIDNKGYRPLMLGAVQSLQIMAKTPGLDQAFPDMADEARVNAFCNALAAIEHELKAGNAELRYLDVESYFNRIERANDETIKLPRNVLAYELSEGAIATLDDYSSVIWPLDLADLYRTLQGNFTGVGILISARERKLTVASPLPNGPAIAAGIRFDDVIVSVDGESTEKWTLNKAVDRITGPEGTFVTLGIQREGVEEPLIFRLKRARIKIDSIRGWERDGTDGWNYFIDPELRIGYVRMTQFIPQTADDLDAAIKQMKQSGPINGLILDLRFNPGGLLRSAVAVTDRFIDGGVVVSTVDVNGRQQEEHKAGKANTYDRFPVVVLVNQGSASASEIVSGALQDYGRAKIIGTRSYGKGSVQDMFQLQNGKALLKLTTQYYRLPSERILHRRPKDTTWGVEPDLVVDVTDQQVAEAVRFRQELDVVHMDDEVLDGDKEPKKAQQLLDEGIDPQLDAALLYLEAKLLTSDVGVAQRNAR